MIVWTHRSLIIPATHAQLARELCATIAGAGGSGMFTTGLSATGTEPATHYISAGLLDEQFAALLPLVTYGEDGEVLEVDPGDPSTVHALAESYGMEVPLADVEALLDNAEVTADDALVTMARMGLGLVLVQEAE